MRVPIHPSEVYHCTGRPRPLRRHDRRPLGPLESFSRAKTLVRVGGTWEKDDKNYKKINQVLKKER